jgi:type IV pilus assembly protein PilA
MSRRARSTTAFTLIELMVVVCILGVLASIAIPSLQAYARRAKTSEAVQNLGVLYGAASSLYEAERVTRGVTATTVTACVAGPTALNPSVPSMAKQKFTSTGGFKQLGFTLADYVYFGYGISSIGQGPDTITCFANARPTSEVYTFFAHGDLDGDSTQSTFELAVGVSEANQLVHARGLYISNETE